MTHKTLSTLERVFNAIGFAACFAVAVMLLLAYFDVLTK